MYSSVFDMSTRKSRKHCLSWLTRWAWMTSHFFWTELTSRKGDIILFLNSLDEHFVFKSFKKVGVTKKSMRRSLKLFDSMQLSHECLIAYQGFEGLTCNGQSKAYGDRHRGLSTLHLYPYLCSQDCLLQRKPKVFADCSSKSHPLSNQGSRCWKLNHWGSTTKASW